MAKAVVLTVKEGEQLRPYVLEIITKLDESTSDEEIEKLVTIYNKLCEERLSVEFVRNFIMN